MRVAYTGLAANPAEAATKAIKFGNKHDAVDDYRATTIEEIGEISF